MHDKLYIDIRTNAVVKITKQVNPHTVMVKRLKDKVRYVVDTCNLKVVDFLRKSNF